MEVQEKRKGTPPLSININAETIVYHCHHCGINGAIARNQGVKMAIVKTEPTPVKKKPINLPST